MRAKHKRIFNINLYDRAYTGHNGGYKNEKRMINKKFRKQNELDIEMCDNSQESTTPKKSMLSARG